MHDCFKLGLEIRLKFEKKRNKGGKKEIKTISDRREAGS